MPIIPRYRTNAIAAALEDFPVVALLGPRQCGKSTLARQLLKTNKELLYLDLERPSDLTRLNDPEWFFTINRDKLICLDEIQRKPEIFPVMRSLCDEWNRPGSFIVLGSSSPSLIRQSSESLAGRISYQKLTPLLWSEVKELTTLPDYLAKGGFPASLLARSDTVSSTWRENFITAFVERDLVQWTAASPVSVRRLWQMLAHVNGHILNASTLSNSLGVSHTTVRNYIDLLLDTYMIDMIRPHLPNSGKRLVKSPKVYISDPGIASSLIGMNGYNQLTGHPSFGSVWEGLVLANLRGHFPGTDIRYYRTSHGAEVDFVIVHHDTCIAVECKAGLDPGLTRGTWSALDDLQPQHTFIAAPVKNGYPLKKGVDVVNLTELIDRITMLLYNEDT